MDTGKRLLPLLILVLTCGLPGLSAAGEINTGPDGGNVAILGYDPVAYFTEQRAVKGSEEIAYKWLGAEWNFSSQEHKAMFSQNPIKYAPQYGGHCSDGVAYGVTVKFIDPTAWRIIDDKLYLHYDEASAVHLEETEGELEKAEANWPGLKAELLEE